MLFILSTADWWFAKQISDTEDVHKRRVYVASSVSMNLSVLAFFKYFHFFVGSAVYFAQELRFHLSEPTLRIILPVGVSFFTMLARGLWHVQPGPLWVGAERTVRRR